MKAHTLTAVSAAFALNQLISALPSHLAARQSIDFSLVDSTPDPTIKPDNTTHLNPAAAIASVIAEVKTNPLPQDKRSLQTRDIVVSTYAGYTANQAIGNAAINAPLDCNKKDTYMGVKLFTQTGFDTSFCAAACTAQSQYNTAHPPQDRPAQTCQFYNTYALYKNDVYQGQYCTLYNQTWDSSYATNTGQWRGNDHYTIQNSYIASNASNFGLCPTADVQTAPAGRATQAPTQPPVDLIQLLAIADPPASFTRASNLLTLTRSDFALGFFRYLVSTSPGTLYEVSFDYFIEGPQSKTTYFFKFGTTSDAGIVSINWDSQSAQPQFNEYYSGRSTTSSADVAAVSCIKANYQPRTIPAYGQWNKAKVAMRAQSTEGVLVMASTGVGNMQWKNIYIQAKDASWCPQAA